MAGTISFRARILLIVVLVALVPLGLVGLWLTRSAGRSGDALIGARMEAALEATITRISDNWISRRSDLLSLATDAELRDRLRSGAVSPVPGRLGRDFTDLGPEVQSLAVVDTTGRTIWSERRAREPSASPGAVRAEVPTFPVRFEIWDSGPSGRRLGWLQARLHADAILPRGSTPPEAAGMVIGLFDTSTGASLVPVSFDPLLLEGTRFQWGGESWSTRRRSLAEPPVTVVVAASISPFTSPFHQAAQRGAALLLGVALVGVVLAATLTRRLTRSLEDLSEAAAAVSGGDLGRRIDVMRDDEVGAVARAFNTMTADLERTLAELASRESLAAVGQFAASLAHEIRNPLTAIRVDLQRVRAALPEGSRARETHERALREITRLDQTVGTTLKAARHAGIEQETFDLHAPVRAAAAAAQPEFDARRCRLTVDLPNCELPLLGDEAALEQLFLNLIQNAAQALEPGGEARVSAGVANGDCVVTVTDDGAGIPDDVLGRVFDPLFTTRPDGTGLGLTIARRIAEAHGGSIEIETEHGSGTRVRVLLPGA